MPRTHTAKPSAVSGEGAAPRAAVGGPRRRALALLIGLPILAMALATVVMQLTGVVGWDAAAHLYKTTLMREGQSIFWDNNWYGGAYQVISYGFVFYWLAKFVDYSALVIVSAGVIPVLFHLYMRRLYGVTSYLPTAALTVALIIYLANGQDPFLFSLALMMGGLVLIAYQRAFLAALLIGLSAFANPLGVVVGAVFIAALAISHRDTMRGTLIRLVLYLLPFVVLRTAATLLFWQPSTYGFSHPQAMAYVAYAVIGVMVARFSLDPRRRAKETLFLTFGVATLIVLAVPGNPVGGNVGRFFLVFGVPLLLCVSDVAIPKVVGVPLLCAIAVGQSISPTMHYVHIASLPSVHADFFAPALEFANEHRDPNYRSHVVALDTHWEAYYFSIDGHPITRGWYRQDDALHNDVLEQTDFDAAEYVAWLRQMAVKYVYLPHAPLDVSGTRESEILRSSHEFRTVAELPDWTVYELLHPEAMVEPLGPNGRARTIFIDHQTIFLRVRREGAYLVKTSYSPYWSVTAGNGSVTESPEGFLVLHAREPGLFGVAVRVTWGSSWDQLVTVF
jgi:hypothetical protein